MSQPFVIGEVTDHRFNTRYEMAFRISLIRSVKLFSDKCCIMIKLDDDAEYILEYSNYQNMTDAYKLIVYGM